MRGEPISPCGTRKTLGSDFTWSIYDGDIDQVIEPGLACKSAAWYSAYAAFVWFGDLSLSLPARLWRDLRLHRRRSTSSSRSLSRSLASPICVVIVDEDQDEDRDEDRDEDKYPPLRFACYGEATSTKIETKINSDQTAISNHLFAELGFGP